MTTKTSPYLLFSENGRKLSIIFSAEEIVDYTTKVEALKKIIEETKAEKIPFSEFQKMRQDILKAEYMEWFPDSDWVEVGDPALMFIKGINEHFWFEELKAKTLEELQKAPEKKPSKVYIKLCGTQRVHAHIFTPDGFLLTQLPSEEIGLKAVQALRKEGLVSETDGDELELSILRSHLPSYAK